MATLVWFCLRLTLREECIVHENICLFDIQILITFFQSMYAIFPSEFCVSVLDWPVHRKRRITICLRLDMFSRIAFSWDEFISNVSRVCGMSWLKFITDTAPLPAELAREYEWATNRAKSLYRVPDDQLLSVIEEECEGWVGVSPEQVLKLVNESRWTRALNVAEARRLCRYRQLRKLRKRNGTSAPSKFFLCCVGQCPDVHPQMSMGSSMSTIISSTSMVWSDHLGRWLTPEELLSFQGFATRQEHVVFPGV